MKEKFRVVFNAPVTLGLVFASFAATLIGVITRGGGTRLLFATYRSPLTDPLTYLRFFTHVIGHNGWSHFTGNAAYLLLLGPILEEKHGSRELLEIIGITALITALINYALFPHVALCGASGVVFAFMLLASFTGFRDREIPVTFLLVAVIFLGQQVYEGLFVQNNISNMAHVVGGVVGSVSGYALNRKKG